MARTVDQAARVPREGPEMTGNVGWHMYHGDWAHGGVARTESGITSEVLRNGGFDLLHSIELDGPVLSMPAIVDGYIYVGVANSYIASGANGGTVYKIELASGTIAHRFTWSIRNREEDAHGFAGMGCTPAVASELGLLYFSAFNGVFYCLDLNDLSLRWSTDLRYVDLDKNQPVNNDLFPAGAEGVYPKAAGWSSPVVVGDRVYVGIGEGENPALYSFVYCLNARSGLVEWVYCTCQYVAHQPNEVNCVPAETVVTALPKGFTVNTGEPVTKGCSVWSSIAYDAELDRLYFGTGNGVPDSYLPTVGWSNGLMALDATTGEFINFTQMPASSNYRPSDFDVDVGAAPTIFDRIEPDGSRRKLVAVAGKNGGLLLVDALTMDIVNCRQLLSSYNDGGQIPTVDPHPANPNQMNPQVSNEVSNSTQAENYHGSYSCPAVDPLTGRIFIGIGGNNYHPAAPAIDSPTTPFMRALDWNDLSDAWEMEDWTHDPARSSTPQPYSKVPTGVCANPASTVKRYKLAGEVMYKNLRECALSSPVVVNDVVFCTTSQIAIHAFATDTGEPLFSHLIGRESGGMNGGYGYCLGAAVYEDFVVAGALVQGHHAGGLLNIYGLAGGKTS